MSEKEEYNQEDEAYSEWKASNIRDLRQEFVEFNSDEFEEYCREEFKRSKE